MELVTGDWGFVLPEKLKLKFKSFDISSVLELIGLLIHEVLFSGRLDKDTLEDWNRLSNTKSHRSLKFDDNSKRFLCSVNLAKIRNKQFKNRPRSEIWRTFKPRRQLSSDQVVTLGYHCDAQAHDAGYCYEKVLVTVKEISSKSGNKINVPTTIELSEVVCDQNSFSAIGGPDSLAVQNEDQVHSSVEEEFIQLIAYRKGVLIAIGREIQKTIGEKEKIYLEQLRYWIWLFDNLRDDHLFNNKIRVMEFKSKVMASFGFDQLGEQVKDLIDSFVNQRSSQRAYFSNFLAILSIQTFIITFCISIAFDEVKDIPGWFIVYALSSISAPLFVLVVIWYRRQYLKSFNRKYLSEAKK